MSWFGSSQQANANLASKPSRVRSNDPFGLDFGDSSSELNEADFGDLENDAALLAELEGLTREMGLPPSNKVANSLQRVSKPEPKPAPKQQQLQLQQPLKLPVPVDLNGHVEVSIPIFSEEDDNDADAEVDLTEADLNDPDLLNELAEVAGISHEHEESEGKNNKLADLMSDMIMGPSSISATVNQITPNLAHTKQQKIIESNTEKIPLLAPELAANPIVEPASVYSLADIKKRQQEYKQAALAFKKTGDAARAREMLVISKSMQETIDFAELGSSLIPASYRLPSVPPSVPLSPATPPIATKQTAPPPDQNKQSTRHNTSAVPKQSQTPISMPTQSIQQSHQSTPTTKTAITSTPTTATITSTPAISITTLPALQNLINSLKSQIETCTQIAHYNLKNNRKDTAVVYHKLKKQYMSDTQILETMAASGYTTATIPVFPAARYDVVRYEIEAINADIGADEIEVCVVRAYDLNPKNIAVAAGGVTNLADVETYVAFDGGVEGVKGQSAVCKGVDPEYGFLRRCGGVKRGDRAVVRHFERKKIVFDVWVQGKGWGMGLFAGKAVQLGRANLNFAPLLNGVELHEIVDIADAANPRRLAGGKLEVKLRIRTPILKPSILTKEERWVAVDFSGNLNNNPSPTTSVSNVAVDVASEQPSPSPSSEIISSRRETPILPQQTVPQKSAGIPISTPKKAVADIDELELEFHNPDTIASNNVLEAEHTAIVAQITSYKAAMKPVPEDLGDRKSAYDLRMNMLITSVQTGTLTMDAYIASVKTCIATTKKQAFAFKDAGKLELTKQALTRIKIMTDEVQEVEAAMASGEL
ncbi:Coiled-coil and C2 domain-containing protein 1B [Physocladia obscura]|uniref:Coiled-coil and C2 domain-containing protein 1B n=1 Tax=Physocladia obscura TaxID=109957 RepID=A0AAD5XGQ2_9FUNG|nr:Coiled-coil and C2 domain-containing protein 1B [Physocladia obscura]